MSGGIRRIVSCKGRSLCNGEPGRQCARRHTLRGSHLHFNGGCGGAGHIGNLIVGVGGSARSARQLNRRDGRVKQFHRQFQFLGVVTQTDDFELAVRVTGCRHILQRERVILLYRSGNGYIRVGCARGAWGRTCGSFRYLQPGKRIRQHQLRAEGAACSERDAALTGLIHSELVVCLIVQVEVPRSRIRCCEIQYRGCGGRYDGQRSIH